MRLGLWPAQGRSTSRSFLQAIFSLRLPHTPSQVWEFASLHQVHCKADDLAADSFPVLQVVWQQLVLESPVFIQAWRTKCSDENTLWSVKQASVLHDASCQHALRVLSTWVSASSSATHQDAMLVEELRASFWTQFTPPTLPQEVSTRQDCEHLLFYDGGIHATSETAAFGAVLIKVNTTSSDASIVWTSGGTLPTPSSTLHQALYKGLIVGLRAAREPHLTQLEVIGCSALVLRQLRDHRPPRDRALANLYLLARQLADLTEVSAWTRHPRAHNKMAGRRGKLGTTPSGENPLEPLRSQDSRAAFTNLLYNDLRPWWPTRVHDADT